MSLPRWDISPLHAKRLYLCKSSGTQMNVSLKKLKKDLCTKYQALSSSATHKGTSAPFSTDWRLPRTYSTRARRSWLLKKHLSWQDCHVVHSTRWLISRLFHSISQQVNFSTLSAPTCWLGCGRTAIQRRVRLKRKQRKPFNSSPRTKYRAMSGIMEDVQRLKTKKEIEEIRKRSKRKK